MTAPPWHALATIAIAAAVVGCKEPARRPSILLFVFDTTRVDAVSAYGVVAGTTPTLDALASAGLRYTSAYAQAPWTLPSHASLFTGLLPSQHGVGWRHTRAPDSWVTLAERLRDGGYETVGVAENAWISDAFNMTQGFERFTGIDVASDTRRNERPDVRATVAEWARRRPEARPFFLFVNVVDAHNPYVVRPTNPFLPPGVDRATAEAVRQDVAYYLCSRVSHERELDVLHGLYLGGVAAADAKLRDVLATLRDAGLANDLVTIVTADHGEHFGEHGLVHHQFSVREALLHVPLIVHGLPHVAPAVVDGAVRLVDVMPSILGWAGVAAPPGLAGRPLPVVARAAATDRPVIAEGFDLGGAPDADPMPVAAAWRKMTDDYRRSCAPEDRVFGDMRAFVRGRMKLIWYARYPAELYDLAADPEERNDLASTRPGLVAELTADLRRRLEAKGRRAGVVAATPEPEGLPSPDVLKRLHALGYLDDDSGAAPQPAQ